MENKTPRSPQQQQQQQPAAISRLQAWTGAAQPAAPAAQGTTATNTARVTLKVLTATLGTIPPKFLLTTTTPTKTKAAVKRKKTRKKTKKEIKTKIRPILRLRLTSPRRSLRAKTAHARGRAAVRYSRRHWLQTLRRQGSLLARPAWPPRLTRSHSGVLEMATAVIPAITGSSNRAHWL